MTHDDIRAMVCSAIRNIVRLQEEELVATLEATRKERLENMALIQERMSTQRLNFNPSCPFELCARTVDALDKTSVGPQDEKEMPHLPL